MKACMIEVRADKGAGKARGVGEEVVRKGRDMRREEKGHDTID